MNFSTGLLIGIVIGAAGLMGILTIMGRRIIAQAKISALGLIDTAKLQAKNEAKEIELKARDEQQVARKNFEKETEVSRNELKAFDLRLTKREDILDKKLDTLTVKERHLDSMEQRIAVREKSTIAKEEQITATLAAQKEKLLQISGMSFEQAKTMLLARIENECKHEAGELITRITDQANEEAKEKSRQIILQAIQRYAADQTNEHTVSTVQIPTDDMKGRVIGREGRNIRAFEKTTGVDVIIDDTPGVVVVSCFDPVRREIARISLERLVQDGRIHPARIEEVFAQVTKEMDDELIKIGKDAIQEANIPNLAKPIIPMLGRLGFRTSYGQNVLKHSLEVAYLSQVIASELGLDPTVARRAGLLHDIGKAMDHEAEGGHPQIGMEFLRKFGESSIILNAAEAHHGDVPATSPYTFVVMAADAISAARPGARRESIERYIERLRQLEDIAKTFEGVRQAYAIQAGREVRVMVDAQKVDDKVSMKIARDIAKRIEADMTYPGEIRVTVLRETRSVEYAR